MTTRMMTSEEKAVLPRVQEFSDNVELQWHPILGRPVKHKEFMAYSLTREDLRNDPCFHVFPSSQHLARALNLGSDELIAKKMYDVLVERYGEGNVKITYYGRYMKNLSVDTPHALKNVHGGCYCIIYRENPFTCGEDFQDKTLELLNDALCEKSFR